MLICTHLQLDADLKRIVVWASHPFLRLSPLESFVLPINWSTTPSRLPLLISYEIHAHCPPLKHLRIRPDKKLSVG